jgi:hypothetical protein
MNDTLAAAIIGLASLVSFVCFVLVLIQMFQHGKTGLGIVCVVLFLCCGLGGLITFVYGWMQAKPWNMTNLMTIWTVAFAIDVVAGIINPAPFQQVRGVLRY